MTATFKVRFGFMLFIFATASVKGQELFSIPDDTETRWSSFENPSAVKAMEVVAIQIMGGEMRDKIREYAKNGAAAYPVTVSGTDFTKLLELPSPPN
jgi:hypothetical protein